MLGEFKHEWVLLSLAELGYRVTGVETECNFGCQVEEEDECKLEQNHSKLQTVSFDIYELYIFGG